MIIPESLFNDPDGVYKSGLATTQTAYEAAVGPLFASLDRLEKMLEGNEYLLGDRLTEADVRLYPTIVRSCPLNEICDIRS